MQVLKSVLLGLVLLQSAAPAGALEILLTNDDGYEAEGINLMFAELVAAGHAVTLVAPRHNNSGRGMAVNTNVFRKADAARVAPRKWYLDGTPVDCVQFGLDVVLADNPPDLIVSGTNHGINPGLGVGLSGTVGAAQNALLRGYPAIAVSAGGNQRDEAAIDLVLDDAARFTVRLIEQITQAGKVTLPAGIGLNVNYPARAAADIAGVVVTRLSSYAVNPFTYKQMKDGTFVAVVRPFSGEPTEAELQEDWHLIKAGFVTITPLDPNLNASSLNQAAVEQLLGEELTP